VPLLAGVAGGLAVVGIAVALLVTAPGFGDLIGARPTPSPSASPTGSGAPSESPAASSTAAATTEVGLRPGQLAPPLEVDRLDGGTINLAALRGQLVWLTFIGSWSPPCYVELPLMEGYWGRLKDNGLTIIGVAIKDTREQAQALVDYVGVTFPVGIDPTSTTEQYWATFAMPVHFWIDRDGVVQAFAVGGIGADEMEDGLRHLLPEEFPTPSPSPTPPASPSPSPSPTGSP
jgi:peroxiredoxin